MKLAWFIHREPLRALKLKEITMLEGMLQATQGCLKEEMRMDVCANNLANANVIGFKVNKISFLLLKRISRL